MSQIVDFYEALNIDAASDLETIQRELNRLERTWKQREITNPEKATKMLAIIIDANTAFASSESRASYDQALAASKAEPVAIDPDAERREQYERWLHEGLEHWSNKAYDLSYNAAQNALRYYRDADDTDGILFFLAARDCIGLNRNDEAYDYVQRAILKSPENFEYLGTQSELEFDFAFDAFNAEDFETSRRYADMRKRTLGRTLDLSRRKGDVKQEIESLSELGVTWYYFPPGDTDKAISYIDQAIHLMKKLYGDDWQVIYEESNAKKVKDDVAEDVGVNVVQRSTSSTGHCYVATAVYGSYDCPQVWVLRRFRDQSLSRTFLGRGFIHLYYAISPRILSVFGKLEPFNGLCRRVLDRMIRRLQVRGFSDLPYED